MTKAKLVGAALALLMMTGSGAGPDAEPDLSPVGGSWTACKVALLMAGLSAATGDYGGAATNAALAWRVC